MTARQGGLVSLTVVLVASLAPSRARADREDVGRAIVGKEFPGWTIETYTTGDLDGDKAADVAVTVKKPSRGGDWPGEAMLAIYLTRPTGKLASHTRAARAVCMGCGGIKSTPDAVIGVPEISSKGVLVLRYEGGARDYWNYKLTWRLDPKTGRFALIGDRVDMTDTVTGRVERGQVELEDINYSTGKAIRRLAGQAAQTCRARRAAASRNLASFAFEEYAWREDKIVRGSCKR